MSILHFQSSIAAASDAFALLTAAPTAGSGAGYIRSTAGTLAPASMRGVSVQELRTFTNASVQLEFSFRLPFVSNTGRGWFTTLTVLPLIIEPAYTLASSNATYLYTSGEGRWSWLAGFTAMVNTRQYEVTLR